MGYSTNYKLYASDSDVLKVLIDDGSLEYLYLQKPGMGEPCATLQGKWYEHEYDLRRLLEFALNRDPAGPRLKESPPKTREDVIIQLIWLGVIA